jgi:hypothetical protein
MRTGSRTIEGDQNKGVPMRALRSIVLAAGLVIATSAANAAVRVFVNMGPSVHPLYASYQPACPGPGYNWVPAYYSYGQYYPGRWVAQREWREQQRREHEWREREAREHHDRDRDHDHDRYDSYR